jgi:hypothetical protein
MSALKKTGAPAMSNPLTDFYRHLRGVALVFAGLFGTCEASKAAVAEIEILGKDERRLSAFASVFELKMQRHMDPKIRHDSVIESISRLPVFAKMDMVAKYQLITVPATQNTLWACIERCRVSSVAFVDPKNNHCPAWNKIFGMCAKVSAFLPSQGLSGNNIVETLTQICTSKVLLTEDIGALIREVMKDPEQSEKFFTIMEMTTGAALSDADKVGVKNMFNFASFALKPTFVAMATRHLPKITKSLGKMFSSTEQSMMLGVIEDIRTKKEITDDQLKAFSELKLSESEIGDMDEAFKSMTQAQMSAEASNLL